jgi:hypothetical protein
MSAYVPLNLGLPETFGGAAPRPEGFVDGRLCFKIGMALRALTCRLKDSRYHHELERISQAWAKMMKEDMYERIMPEACSAEENV